MSGVGGPAAARGGAGVRGVRAWLLALVLAGPLAGADFLPAVPVPGTRLAAIEAPHLTAVVPAAQAEALRPLVAWADAAYARMAADAGYRPARLTLLLTDAADDHNGFSTVAPVRLVQVDLAPAGPSSTIFAGAGHLERTLVHEFAHHIANDRNHGFRGALEAVFGRVYPGDLLSLLTAYLAMPAQVTMPSFWHEAVAQWAETSYADPASPWAGRGRDSLTHMVWRLDAASGELPSSDGWRSGWIRWPWGARPYLYGLAYSRWLEARYGRGPGLWALVEEQSRQWAFAWERGVEDGAGTGHSNLISDCLRDLAAEQRAALARLAERPATGLRRLTPEDAVVGAPAWLPDGRLLAPFDDRYGRKGLVRLGADGRLEDAGLPLGSGLRSLPDGSFAMAGGEADGPGLHAGADEPAGWMGRSRITLAAPDGVRRTLAGTRLLQPDLRREPGDAEGPHAYRVAAVRLLPAGAQELVLCSARVGRTWLADRLDRREERWEALPVEGRPWSPAFRPGSAQLAWVETVPAGSRLVLADPARPGERTVLAELRGRILHPAWSPDGAWLYFCADHTGVANAWRVAPGRPGDLQAVTHVVGGVLACVPSPDGLELALLDHDRRGPYLARLPLEPAAFPGEPPRLALAWPAPVEPAARPGATAAPPEPLGAGDPGSLGPAGAYRGLLRMRPRFWSPTSEVTPRGGWGAAGLMADPLLTHQLVAGIGAGDHQGTLVWSGAYLCAAWPLELGLAAWREERTWEDLVVETTGFPWDYVEQVTVGEARLGTGLAAEGFRPVAWIAAGAANHRAVREVADRYQGRPLAVAEPFQGRENYLEAMAAWSSGSRYPTSYARESASKLAASWRHSGLDGDLHGKRLLITGSYVASVWPRGGHQAYAGGAIGWSRGYDGALQRPFQVGGDSGLDLPRGYPDIQAVGDHFLGWTAGWRMPLWRPFAATANSSFGLRQLVLEGFFDAAQASNDRPRGDGDWYRSSGGELHADLELWALRLAPGIGVAHRLDGPEGTSGYFTLGFTW